MTHDECLVFKSFDSQVGGTTQFGFRVAWHDDPSVASGTAFRDNTLKSIVVFDHCARSAENPIPALLCSAHIIDYGTVHTIYPY
jgi:hypothetical protein